LLLLLLLFTVAIVVNVAVGNAVLIQVDNMFQLCWLWYDKDLSNDPRIDQTFTPKKKVYYRKHHHPHTHTPLDTHDRSTGHKTPALTLRLG
jgi:hypothetical protein